MRNGKEVKKTKSYYVFRTKLNRVLVCITGNLLNQIIISVQLKAFSNIKFLYFNHSLIYLIIICSL